MPEYASYKPSKLIRPHDNFYIDVYSIGENIIVAILPSSFKCS